MDQESYNVLKRKVLAAPDAATGVPEFYGLLKKEYEELLDFIATRDAEMVKVACDGIGTDDALLIKVLCHRTREQIQRANEKFIKKSKTSRTIMSAVKSECSGNYGAFMTALTQNEAAAHAETLKSAFGMMSDTKVINELFTTLSNSAIAAMRRSYEGSTDENLHDKLQSKLGGQHEKLILDLLQKGRAEGPADPAAAEETATKIRDLIKEGSSMMGGVDNKTERRVIDALRKCSPAQCQEVQTAYEKISGGKSLRKTIKDKFSGALEDGLLCLLKDPVDALCAKLKAATDGMGCDEAAITRIIGGNEKPQVRAICNRYLEKYGRDFRSVVKSETGSHFQEAILQWIDASDPTHFYHAPADDVEIGEAEVDALIQAICHVRSHIANFDYYLLQKAGKGVGTDEALAIKVLCRRTKSHLAAVDDIFRGHEGGHEDIQAFIDAEFDGNLQDFLLYTQMEEDEFDAITLFEAFKGIGCDEGAVVEVLTTRPFSRIHAARVYYEARNDRSLMDDMIDELSGNLEYLCCRLLAGSRAIAEKNGANLTCTPEEWADRLYNAGSGKFGTDEKEFIDFITGNSLAEIQSVAAAYESRHGQSLEGAIKSEFSGDLEHGLINLLFDPLDVYARYIKEYCDGIGTNEEGLNRVLAGNDKGTVQQIKERYFHKYGQALAEELKDELSGDYEIAALSWIEPPAFSDGYLQPLISKFSLPPPPEPEIVPDELPPISDPKPEVSKPPGPTPEEIEAENARLAAEQEEIERAAKEERTRARIERLERQARIAEEKRLADERENERLRAELEQANEEEEKERLRAEQTAIALRRRLAEEEAQREQMEKDRRKAEKLQRRAARRQRKERRRDDSSSSSSSSSDSDGGGHKRRGHKACGRKKREGRANIMGMRAKAVKRRIGIR